MGREGFSKKLEIPKNHDYRNRRELFCPLTDLLIRVMALCVADVSRYLSRSQSNEEEKAEKTIRKEREKRKGMGGCCVLFLTLAKIHSGASDKDWPLL